jgi:hypothetical protein
MTTSDGAERRSDHTCLLFRGLGQQKQYLLPFLKDGLTQGEHCLLVCPADSVDDWSLEIQAFGIDVRSYLDSGALVIATGEQWRESPFGSITKARELWQYIEENLARFPAVRIAGDAGWAALEPPIGADALCHWEATADLIYEDVPVKTVCMYDLNRHSPADVRAALRTHSRAVVDGASYRNPYYEAAKILDSEPHLNASDADAIMIEKMLASLRTAPPA